MKTQALDRAHDAAGGLEMDMQVRDLEQGRGPLWSDEQVRLCFHPGLGDFVYFVGKVAPDPYT